MNNVFIGDINTLLDTFYVDKKYSSIFVLVDENTKKHCYGIVKDNIPKHTVIEIESGEQNKNLTTCTNVWDTITKSNSDRKALLINLGGGVITDLGGFCASAYKRGIEFINIPTTLLGMVDASIGGKVGVDFNGYKNQLGFFEEANAILVDKQFLTTLEDRQVKSGLAEMIKHALISDLDLEKIIEANNVNLLTDGLIRDSINFKKSVVEQDFFEDHYRKILNFGHTIGHCIESFFLKTTTPLLHGEAIIIGMICESYLSYKKTSLSVKTLNIITDELNSIFSFKTFDNEEIVGISKFAIQDKKNSEMQVKSVLIESIGSPKIDVIITQEEIENALQFYNSIQK